MSLKKWTSYLDQQNYPVLPVTSDDKKCFVLFEAEPPANVEEFIQKLMSVPVKERKKVCL